ncbi:hypothetical protein [Chamaesiphon sp. GL140_3_metabinner_50]|uniref:hypothetical protein n=1 Tax=Chamaesiphon sp. GL140_3_metabinner_50 TaxID=2970812 RepID=UPI0025ECA297|nr:hypothetical protein [Chamaesiphon sp. GL140_3_metabinner_50]
MNKQNLFKVVAISAAIGSSILLQAQSSQAIPLDDILDSAGKSFVQQLLGRPEAKKPDQKQPAEQADANNATSTVDGNATGETNNTSNKR